jgi:hypothetical protein
MSLFSAETYTEKVRGAMLLEIPILDAARPSLKVQNLAWCIMDYLQAVEI